MMGKFWVAILESCITLGEFVFKSFLIYILFSNKIFHLLRIKPHQILITWIDFECFFHFQDNFELQNLDHPQGLLQ